MAISNTKPIWIATIKLADRSYNKGYLWFQVAFVLPGDKIGCFPNMLQRIFPNCLKHWPPLPGNGYSIPMPDTSRASRAAALSVMPPTKSRIFM